MSLTVIAFWIIYLLGVGAALMTPLVGVLLYILIYHLNPEYQWWGESVRVLGLRTSMTIVIATVAGIVLRFPRFEKHGSQAPLPIVLGIMLVIWACMSMAWGYGASDRGIYMAEKIIKVMIFILIMIRCVREPQHYHLFVIVWLCGVFYIGYQAYGNVGTHISGRLAHGIGGPDFAESSGLAVHLVSVLPLIGAMFFLSRCWWIRALILLTGALTINTLIMTRTRNAIVGVIAMVVVAMFSLPRGYRRKGWLAIAVGLFLSFYLTDSGWWSRIETITNYKSDPSATSRIAYWGAAIRMVQDYPMGIGLGNFHHVIQDYTPNLHKIRAAHSTYFAGLAELGYPGFTLLMLVIFTALWRLTRIRKQASQFDSDIPVQIGRLKMRFHLGWHAMALRVSLCGYLACGNFTTRLWTEDFWIMIGMVCCLSNITKYMRAEAHVTRTPLVDLPMRSPTLETT